MPAAEVATTKVKIVPDLSEFAQLLTQELDLDDPLAKAIVAATPSDLHTVRATVGDQNFELHHWTITTDEHGPRLRTAWRTLN